MKNHKFVNQYQKLSAIQKVSIPLILASLFGFILTIILIKQVQEIDDNTFYIEKQLIPTLEKANNNLAMLYSLPDKFTYAVLSLEEDLIENVQEQELIEKNLQDIIDNNSLQLDDTKVYLEIFQSYFKLAHTYALNQILDKTPNPIDESDLLMASNKVKYHFGELKLDIYKKIEQKNDRIHKLSQKVVLYTVSFVILFAMVLFFTSYVTYIDYKDYSLIEEQKEELFSINQKVQNSMDYAALMQMSILPDDDVFLRYTKQHMICWQPKYTVGGDIYFISELESQNEIIIMVIDGVGHGVSGAFLTILVKAIETQIIADINKGTLEPSPAKILQYFNQTIKMMLKQDQHSRSNSGFDGSVLYYNRITRECKYAGAKAPLYIVTEDGVEVIKGNRTSVGFIRTDIDQTYTEYEIEVQKDAKYYLLTDGMIDQEGENHDRYGKKRFKQIIFENHHKLFIEQKGNMFHNFQMYKKNFEQSDDITVLGIQFI
ncbi:MAG: PP2C family protein-serine/threonine phosphatase [bacterium]